MRSRSTSCSSILKAFSLVALVLMACAPGALADGKRNGLPPTTMDSFVRTAGAKADLIYGDEGTYQEPPYFGFTAEHRINAGITGQRDAGLTTGHGDMLPDAWGRDEFLGQEWSQGGKNGGQYNAATTSNIQPSYQPSGSSYAAGRTVAAFDFNSVAISPSHAVSANLESGF